MASTFTFFGPGTLDVPVPPRGMAERQLYDWARRMYAFLQANNFASVEPTVSIRSPLAPKPDPTIFASVVSNSGSTKTIHFELRDSTGSRVNERRWIYVYVLTTGEFDGNVGIGAGTRPETINQWSIGGSGAAQVISTMRNSAAYLVNLHSTSTNLWSTRDSTALVRYYLHSGFPHGQSFFHEELAYSS